MAASRVAREAENHVFGLDPCVSARMADRRVFEEITAARMAASRVAREAENHVFGLDPCVSARMADRRVFDKRQKALKCVDIPIYMWVWRC